MQKSIITILEYARLAPSVHNTQPWRFVIDGSTIVLMVAPERLLSAGDPTGRQLWMSLGICLETIMQAASGLGLKATIDSVRTESRGDVIARVRIGHSLTPRPDILSNIKNRHSYREPMAPAAIDSSFIKQLKQSIADIPDVTLLFVKDKKTVRKVATIADKGMQLALSSGEFRKELAPLLHSNWSHARTGLHGFALGHGFWGSVWEKWSVAFGIGNDAKGRADRQRLLQASGLIFIVSKGDVAEFWLNAGRAYMRIALEITHAGFVHSTITAPVEAARFHEDIEKMIDTSGRVQSLIRVGAATQPLGKVSPRLRVEELIDNQSPTT